MNHGSEITVVILAIGCLGLGALTRVLAGHGRLPYTVALLLLGLGLGLVFETDAAAQHLPALVELAANAAAITPNLIIYVFLPALIFESAFALEAYGFRRNLGPIVVLAVVGLVASAVLTALTMQALTRSSWGWSLPAALVFGALISATDPVAVVAILRSVGAPKRLAMLIEGESLMNDGTAIVLFNALLAVLATGAQLSPGAAVVDFTRVVIGGVVVGAALGAVATAWLSRTFNDPMVEITLTLVTAYAAMLIAEHVLHVSGVMAIVTAGLWLSSIGRPRISPEVLHFLHQFWEMLAYFANTVIFVLVGILLAGQLEHAHWSDLLVIAVAYLVLQVIRFATTLGLLPLMNRVGDRIDRNQAIVMSWSGLRGAVSLALALVVSQHPALDEGLRSQILLATAGVVFLTIVINGSTVGLLLARFGFDQPPLADQVAQADLRANLLDRVRGRITELADELPSVHWSEVDSALARKRTAIDATRAQAVAQLRERGLEHGTSGYFQQALSLERQAYWQAHAEGVLGTRALRVLCREVDIQLDRLGRDDQGPPATRISLQDDLLSRLARLARKAGLRVGSAHFEHVALRYDMSRGVDRASERVLSFLEGLGQTDGPGATARAELKSIYRRYRHQAREHVEDLRTNLPEMTEAIETRLATRIELNLEREGYNELVHSGALDAQAAQGLLDEVEVEMKRLLLLPTALSLPETADLCRRASMFMHLDALELQQIAEMTKERVVSAGEEIFRQGQRGDSMFVIARGAVQVVRRDEAGEEHVVDVLGGGDVIGEMALLSGDRRSATIRAATTVTLGEVRREDFEQLMQQQTGLRERIWAGVFRRLLDNHLATHSAYRHLDRTARHKAASAAELHHLRGGESLHCPRAGLAFVFAGQLEYAGSRMSAPTLFEIAGGSQLVAQGECRVAVLDSAAVMPTANAGRPPRPAG